jgi:hypothetical protein
VDLSTAVVQFYFAATDARTGEAALVDAVVQGPTGAIAHNQPMQTHAEINIKPNVAGEYSLCLSHSGSPTDKNIDVDVTLPDISHLKKDSEMDEASRKVSSTVDKLNHELQDIVHTLRYLKTHEMRNQTQIVSISSWVWNISLLESVLIVGIASAQVAILRTFFSRPTGSKQRI